MCLTDYLGFQIITSIHMVEPGEPYDSPRSWRTRLLTRPWRPLRATERITPMVPSSKAVRMGNRLIMHPEMAEALEHSVNNSEPIELRVETYSPMVCGAPELLECSMVPAFWAEPECRIKPHVQQISGLPFLVNTTGLY